MRFRDDERAVTVQIGAILLFATLIIGLSLYQATVVPSQNADVEYKHSQTVQNQLTDVRNALLRTAGSGNTQPVSVSLGTQYPSRVFMMNPPPAAATLRTGAYENGTVQLSNVDATNNETRDFLAGSWNASTKYLAYEPDYNEYDNAPDLLYESSVLSNYYADVDNGSAIPLTDQLLVDNETKTITLVTLNGSLSTTRASVVSVTPEALSVPYQRVQVEKNDTTDPAVLSVPTKISAAQLQNRTDLGSHPGVIDVSDHPTQSDRVLIEVDWDGQFTLQTARVGVGSDTENPAPHYLTLIENRGDRVTVEARDRFNNAESGVTVTVGSGASLFEQDERVTGENGQATFEVAENESGDVILTILDNSSERERVTVDVDASAGGGGGDGGDGGNGSGPTPQISFRVDDLTHTNENAVEYVGSYNVSNTNASFQRVEVQFENTDQGGASQTLQETTRRGGLRYTSSYGADDTYDITYQVIYTDDTGSEYVAASRTVTDEADAVNPSGNEDLSASDTATLETATIDDRSNNGQGPQFQVDSTVSTTGGFSQTRFVAVATGSGGKASATSGQRSASLDANPTYGYQRPFKLAVLVYGPDGAVVDGVIVIDPADGNDP